MACNDTDVNFVIFYGANFTRNLTIKENSVALDITGYTFKLIIKNKVSDEDSEAIFEKDWTTHIAPTSGQTVMTMTDIQTQLTPGSYTYAVRMERDNGQEDIILTGRFQVKLSASKELIS